MATGLSFDSLVDFYTQDRPLGEVQLILFPAQTLICKQQDISCKPMHCQWESIDKKMSALKIFGDIFLVTCALINTFLSIEVHCCHLLNLLHPPVTSQFIFLIHFSFHVSAWARL